MNKFFLIAAVSLPLLNYSTANAVSATVYNVSDHCSCTGWRNPSLVCTLDNSKQDSINFYDMSVIPYKQVATAAPGEAVLVPLTAEYQIESKFKNLGSGYTINKFAEVEEPVGYAVADTMDSQVSSLVITWGIFNPVTCEFKPQL